jgi:methionyl-tRNA formyltransferase
VPSLEAMLDPNSGIEVVAVVTNPDKPAGRGMKLKHSPVKEAAVAAGIEVHQPANAKDPNLAWVVKQSEAEVAVVVAYGKILPADLLAVPPLGFVNVHFSLLPEYRGAAPVQRAIIDGKPETGVSIMVLTEGMDEGPVLAMEREAVSQDDTAGAVGERLARVGADLLVKTLPSYVSGELTPVEQDHDAASYAPKISDDEARVDWTKPAAAIHDLVRGSNPAPGAWTTFRDARLKIHSSRPADPSKPAEVSDLEPGALAVDGEHLYAGTGEGILELAEVQPATRKRMPGVAFARGSRMQAGERVV